MQRRAVRLTLLALLVVTAIAAAALTWDIQTRIRSAIAREHAIDGRLDRMSAATAALGAAQQAYVAPGQQRGDALTRASVLVQQVYDDIAAMRLAVRSNEAPASLLAFGGGVDALVNVDDRARQHLQLDQDLMAADLVYTEARQALEGMMSHLEALRSAERRFTEIERGALFAREASILGTAALIWLVGILALVRLPARRDSTLAAESGVAPTQRESMPSGEIGALDLAAAANVCAELARLSTAAALPPTLARAARVLDASGLVIWLGAGEELFPAMGHGYGPRTLARLGPVPRAAENATATTWRTGEMSIVPGSAEVNGAIVSPLFTHGGCFGVMAAEVRHGRENDTTSQAVARMIAAQLSMLVAPWPAASNVESGSRRAETLPSDPAASERTAAASA